MSGKLNWRMSQDLNSAVEDGNYEKVERLLAEGGADVNYKGAAYGSTPLIIAAIHGHPQIAYLLFLSGADLHATGDYGKTAAYNARLNNHPVLAACLDQLATPPTITLASAAPTTTPAPPSPNTNNLATCKGSVAGGERSRRHPTTTTTPIRPPANCPLAPRRSPAPPRPATIVARPRPPRRAVADSDWAMDA